MAGVFFPGRCPSLVCGAPLGQECSSSQFEFYFFLLNQQVKKNYTILVIFKSLIYKYIFLN
jgi:hypothetical protein